MENRFDWQKNLPRIFWLCAVIAFVAWALQPGYVVGWDLRVIHDAILSLRAGRDPYADAIAAQGLFLKRLLLEPHAQVPFSYVYTPVTLLPLRLAGHFSFWLTGAMYWIAYAAGMVFSIYFAMQWLEEGERRVFAYLAPVAVFFPGLLQNDVVFSGNVAIILYGAVFVGLLVGVRTRQWWLLYVAVLVASCFKGPMLSLLVIPMLLERGQWMYGVATGVAGVGLFGLQRVLWPQLFANYLETLDLMFRVGKDFSSSPAGLMSEALYGHVPYRLTLTVCYLLYAIPILIVLGYLSRQYQAERFGRKDWIPVMVLGVLLLNPRINEYDVAPVTLLMALVAWRGFARGSSRRSAIVKMGVFFAVINGVALGLMPVYPAMWKCVECLTLVGLFGSGAWRLARGMSEGQEAGVERQSRTRALG